MNVINKPWCCVLTIALLTHLTNLHAQTTTKNQTAAVDVEGKLELELANRQLLGTDSTTTLLKPSFELDLQYKPNERLKIGANLEFSRELEEGNDTNESENTDSLDVKEAYLKLSNLNVNHSYIQDISLTIGRKNISDSREWFYDAEVDGLIFEVGVPSLSTTLSFSFNREEWADSDLLQDNEAGTVDNLIVSVENETWDDIVLRAHYVTRSDSSDDNDSPNFVGLSVRGKALNKRLTFWSDLAKVDGLDGNEHIEGIGYDIGATLKMDSIGKPYVTLGYAFGSGDGDDDTDFRQTGLHDNVDKFGGVTNFKYYGEVVDPELSNLRILTAGVGFRPLKKVSIDVLYHSYEQQFALDELRDSDLSTDPNGMATDIGYEWDLVAGFKNRKNIETKFILGYFKPGEAFEDRTGILLLNAKLTYQF